MLGAPVCLAVRLLVALVLAYRAAEWLVILVGVVGELMALDIGAAVALVVAAGATPGLVLASGRGLCRRSHC